MRLVKPLGCVYELEDPLWWGQKIPLPLLLILFFAIEIFP